LDKRLALDIARRFALARSKLGPGTAGIIDYLKHFQLSLMHEINEPINQEVLDFVIEVSLNFIERSSSAYNDLFGRLEANDFVNLYKSVLALENSDPPKT